MNWLCVIRPARPSKERRAPIRALGPSSKDLGNYAETVSWCAVKQRNGDLIALVVILTLIDLIYWICVKLCDR